MTERAGRVPKDEQPEPTVENVPDGIVAFALSQGTQYVECPECENRQFVAFTPGRNGTAKCNECEERMRI